MAQTRFRLGHAILLVILASAALGAPRSHASDLSTKATGTSDAGRLIIKRSFTLGGVPVLVKVDGVLVAALNYNRGYEGPIAPGTHSLKLIQIPNTASSRSKPTPLTVREGQTYHLTATRVGHQVLLR